MKSIKLTTPIGKAIYPKFQPDYFFDKKGVNSCKLHVSKEDFESFEPLSASVSVGGLPAGTYSL